MSLDIYFFKKGFDIQKSRDDIDATYTRLQAIKEELEQLENAYDEAKLSSLNITHNLNKMAQAVGLYDVLWNPEKIGITTASQMIAPLEKGIKVSPNSVKLYSTFGGTTG
jgi:hypothetical protein